jgi:hypothetical protein
MNAGDNDVEIVKVVEVECRVLHVVEVKYEFDEKENGLSTWTPGADTILLAAHRRAIRRFPEHGSFSLL